MASQRDHSEPRRTHPAPAPSRRRLLGWGAAAPAVAGLSALVGTGAVVGTGALAPAVAGSGAGPRPLPSSGRLAAASPFELVALTWRGPARPARLRVRQDGAWTPWREVHALADGPTDGGAEEVAARGVQARGAGAARVWSEPVWVGRSDAVEVAGGAASDLRAVLLTGAGTAVGPASSGLTGAASAPTAGDGVRAAATPTGPPIFRRSQWGADERWRSREPSYNDVMQQVHVHHTAGTNVYAREDVPRLLRSIYRYHSQTLGWSDIGYNFLIDRFGRIFEGRYGGTGRLVTGAHTLGFNHNSTGIALIGNFETARPTDAALTALVKLAGWKFALAGRSADVRVWARSQGSDRYPSGTQAVLWAMDGHRDTNQTACPGRYLYSEMALLRRRTQNVVRAS